MKYMESNYVSIVPNSTHCFGCHKSNLDNKHFCDLSPTKCGLTCPKAISEKREYESMLEDNPNSLHNIDNGWN